MIGIAHRPEHHVRDRLVLQYTPRKAAKKTSSAPGFAGDPDTLKLPRWMRGISGDGKPIFVELTLKKGDNPDVPTSYFHAIGPEVAELIAAGVIKSVCKQHVFDDLQPACRYCGVANPLY